MAVAHVDDFLISIDQSSEHARNALAAVRALYEWGTWEEGSFTQCGARVIQSWDRAQGYGAVTLDMQEYADGIEEINAPPARRRHPESRLTKEEGTALKSLLCQMLWVAEQACPLLSAPLSLSPDGASEQRDGRHHPLGQQAAL